MASAPKNPLNWFSQFSPEPAPALIFNDHLTVERGPGIAVASSTSEGHGVASQLFGRSVFISKLAGCECSSTEVASATGTDVAIPALRPYSRNCPSALLKPASRYHAFYAPLELKLSCSLAAGESCLLRSCGSIWSLLASSRTKSPVKHRGLREPKPSVHGELSDRRFVPNVSVWAISASR